MALVDSFAAVIFDYGGVLVHHQADEDQARMAAIAGLPSDVFSEAYWSDRSEYDRGTESGIEYWQGLAQRAGVTFTLPMIEQLIEVDTIAWMHFDLPMFDWAEELRDAGKRIGILSNMPRELGEALKTRTKKFQMFDHVTLSYEENSVKPEPAIYEHCLLGLGVMAHEALFLDDRLENVQGAERLGIRAVQFTSREAVLPRLVAAE